MTAADGTPLKHCQSDSGGGITITQLKSTLNAFYSLSIDVQHVQTTSYEQITRLEFTFLNFLI